MPKLPLHHLNRFKALPHSTKRNLIGITGLLLFSILIFLWHYFSTHITTENAYVNANAVRIAAQVSGPVLNLFVDNNQGVTAGQPLFEIDPTPFIAAVDEANAQILQNKAKLKNALINLERVEKLVAQKFLSPESKDNLAAAIGEERGTIEDVLEPFLIQQGFLMRTPRGRIATKRSYQHFGIILNHL